MRYLFFLIPLAFLSCIQDPEVEFILDGQDSGGSGGSSSASLELEYLIPAPNHDITFTFNTANPANVVIDWGDSSSTDTVNKPAATAGSITHTYTAAGTYTITMTGSLGSLGLNHSELEHVLNLGDMGWTDFTYMFNVASNLKSISGGVTNNVTSMQSMFNLNSSLSSVDLSTWDFSSVTTMYRMFGSAGDGTLDIDLSSKTAPVLTTVEGMFEYADVNEVNLSGLNAPILETIEDLFKDSNVVTINMDNFNVSNVTDFSNAFTDTSNLTALTFDNWDVANGENFSEMFRGTNASDLSDVSGWSTTSMISVASMFYSATNIASLNLASWNTTNVTNFIQMFAFTSSLTTLDISSFDTTSATNTSYMFRSSAVNNLTFPSTFNINVNGDYRSMFLDFTGSGTLDVSSFELATYANISNAFSGITGLVIDARGWPDDSFIGNAGYRCLGSPVTPLDGSITFMCDTGKTVCGISCTD